ncbi:integrase [Secundilactobacillus pentosiphilus]|uniref:Integrase n=1 Tax=Secundilactobacillus pentosiphilus TaxID=1714682 RepID=A0A1Z5IN23_9LACO|nr:integrase [Secundilactobacillus pentosiphilus]
MASGLIRRRYGHYYYSFEVGKTKDGHRQRVERYGGETKGEAESALRKALQEFENGGVQVVLTNMSVSQYFNYWYENYVLKNLKENTQTNYPNIINKYTSPRIGKYKMSAIGPAAL